MDQPPDDSGDWERYVRERDGHLLWLKTSRNSTGYENVIEPHKGKRKPFAVKFSPDPSVKGQRHLPDSASYTGHSAGGCSQIRRVHRDSA